MNIKIVQMNQKKCYWAGAIKVVQMKYKIVQMNKNIVQMLTKIV